LSDTRDPGAGLGPDRTRRTRGLPLPREHGAWVMLYAPLLTAIIVYRVDAILAALLVGLATAAFFAQNALGLLLRERGDARTWRWLIVCCVLVLGATMILWVAGHGRVLLLGVPAIVLLSWQGLKRRWTRRQIDHSLLNEMLTVSVLGMGAPAAHIVATRSITLDSWVLWLAFSLYFFGSVLFVKMMVGAARDASPPPLRWRRGGISLIYHLLIMLLLLFGLLMPDTDTMLLQGLIAFLPAMLRAGVGWWQLSMGQPALRRLGFMELAVAIWFSAWVGVGGSGWLPGSSG
jgi:hypothetical protein